MPKELTLTLGHLPSGQGVTATGTVSFPLAKGTGVKPSAE